MYITFLIATFKGVLIAFLGDGRLCCLRAASATIAAFMCCGMDFGRLRLFDSAAFLISSFIGVAIFLTTDADCGVTLVTFPWLTRLTFCGDGVLKSSGRPVKLSSANAAGLFGERLGESLPLGATGVAALGVAFGVAALGEAALGEAALGEAFGVAALGEALGVAALGEAFGVAAFGVAALGVPALGEAFGDAFGVAALGEALGLAAGDFLGLGSSWMAGWVTIAAIDARFL